MQICCKDTSRWTENVWTWAKNVHDTVNGELISVGFLNPQQKSNRQDKLSSGLWLPWAAWIDINTGMSFENV